MFNFKQVRKLTNLSYSFCNQPRLSQPTVRNEKFTKEIHFPFAKPSLQNTKPASPQNTEHKVLNDKFTKLLEVIDGNTVKNAFLYQRIVMEFREIFKISDHIIHNKENALRLINILVKLKIDSEKIHFKRKESTDVDCFEISQETPENFLLFSKTWEKVLIKSNIALKDPDLLFETIYQVPRTYSENIDMGSYTERYLSIYGEQIPVSLTLFFLSKMLVQNKRTAIPDWLMNSVLKRYAEIKTSLFDLGMTNFVYYQCLSKYYVAVNKLNKWNMAQNISMNLESKFQTKEGINIGPILGEGEAKTQLFYELILRDVFDYIERFEIGEINVSEKVFIQSLIFLFKSFSRFSIQHKELCEAVDKYTSKYKQHLSLVDKLTLLMTYAKYLNIIPTFASSFEEDIGKALQSLSWTLKYKPKTTFIKSILDNVFINEEYYMHLKKKFKPDFKEEDLPPFFQTGNMPSLSINQILEIYWYLGKTNTGQQSPNLIKMSNSLLSLCFDLYTKYQLADALQSACSLSSMTPEGTIDWKSDFEFKLNLFAKKFKNWDPLVTREPPFFSINSLYKNLTYIKLKYGIETFDYFTPNQVDYFKKEWFDSLKRYRSSKVEKKVYDILNKYFKENNIKRGITQNKLVGLHIVDIFIEPDIIMEINGKIHFPKNSSLEIMSQAYFGNYFIKTSLYEAQGYKLILLNYFEFEDIQNDDEKLEAFVVEKIKNFV